MRFRIGSAVLMATVVLSCVRFASGDSNAVGGHTKNERTEVMMARDRNEADPSVQEQRGVETTKGVIEKVVSFGRSVSKSSSGVENGVKTAGQHAVRAATGVKTVGSKQRGLAKKLWIAIVTLSIFVLAGVGLVATIRSGIP